MNKSLRYRLFLLTAALLYLGPLLSGLAGGGWQVVPTFTLIFVLWLLVMRPGMWPARPADWANARILTKTLFWAFSQAVLVTFCLAIGRGIGGTMGTLAAIPVWVPLLMSLLAVPLSRIFWQPGNFRPEMYDYLDRETLKRASDHYAAAEAALAEGAGTGPRYEPAACQPWADRLAALPPTADNAAILAILRDAVARLAPLALLDTIAEAASAARANPILRRAFILLATEADVTGKVLGQGQLSRAFDLAGEDAARLQLFAERTMAALKLRRMALMDTPPIQRLRDVARRHPDAGSALTALGDQMDRLSNA